MDSTQNKFLWWQKGIVYQVYPRSFMDSNGDGVGDIRGILSTLDYLKWLGVQAVWVSPVYPSPMADFGYDISDYTGIHPLFGSLADFDLLVDQLHARGMKLILDLVPNHTSDQHPWFLESRSSRNNPRRDWYLWQDAGKDGSPPNNWLSVFGGSAWEWDETTGQYYYHAFLKEQPDLNWRNPQVQQHMLEVMRFWLDRGVDGFRVDVMWHMVKDDQWRNNPPNPDYKPHMATYEKLVPAYSTDQPEVHEIVHMMRQLVNKYEQRLIIGEIYLPIQKLVTYYGINNQGAHLPFNFQLIALPWNARQISSAIDLYEGALPKEGWPNWVLGNHDQSRIASRVGTAQARIAAMLLLTLRGTPTIYYGDELGMHNVPIPEEEVQDPQGLNMPGLNLSRDPFRTPMQWNDHLNAGFTTGKPWLRLADDYKQNNVQIQKNSPDSMLTLYCQLINLRNSEPALHIGNYTPVRTEGDLLAFIREADKRFLIVLNLSSAPGYFVPADLEVNGHIRLSTLPQRQLTSLQGEIALSENEGLIIQLA